MAEKLTLDWSYTPADFFEEPFEHNGEGYTLEVKDGRVVATVSANNDEQNEELFRKIHEDLKLLFLGAQLISNKPYQLSSYSITRTRPDRKRDIVMRAEGGKYCLTGGNVDLAYRDSAGNAIADTKRERIEERKKFALLAMKHGTDPVTLSLLKSYDAAINDANNELTYLYEIRDALAEKFGGDGNACSALDLTSNQWSRFGYLANNAPLSQGRHRGKKIGELREATPAELDEARTIAKQMIRAYLHYLERTNTPSQP